MNLVVFIVVHPVSSVLPYRRLTNLTRRPGGESLMLIVNGPLSSLNSSPRVLKLVNWC